MTGPAVRFERVQKSYDGETLVVKDLNLSIPHGEFLTLLGPSGSGKSTCLMMLAGFESATGGKIYLNEESINRVPPHKRNIGMVFQNYALFPHKTVAENLAYPLKVRKLGKTDIEAKVARALDRVQLKRFGNRRPAMLSGGQQQRVAVARALIFDPEIVLMDEPLGALDKQLREQMQYEIKDIHENLGVTVVYVTHDQTEALTMSNRIAVFNDGVIQQLAPPLDLYEKPENAFVAGFIGENNQLRGLVKSARGGECVVQLHDGSLVTARCVNVAGAGSATTLSLRPERVEINPPDGKHPNRFEGRVEQLLYLGDHMRIRVSLCGHDDFIVKVPNASMHPGLNAGNSMTFGWAPENCRALEG
ncbi:MAG: ABC transporter ATP-binding protein [Gammaproteobacteria bacterium]|nr:ABC transporter ATP-binding protein [Gammaproteobacteria bacterium]